jgi:hypothetical protein
MEMTSNGFTHRSWTTCVQQYACMHIDRHIYIYTYVCNNVDMCIYSVANICQDIYIYIYLLTPRNLPVSIFIVSLQWFVLVFAFKSSQHLFDSFEDFGCLNMMSHDASCVDTMTYFDGLRRFRLPYCVPNKGFQFKHWQNAHGTVAKCQFKASHWFLQCFCSFLWHVKFWIGHLQILQIW